MHSTLNIRSDSPNAANRIEQRMKQSGIRVVMPHISAIVLGREGPLEEGTEEKFRQIGTELARLAAAS